MDKLEVTVKEVNMTNDVINQIIEIDKLFYLNFDYSNTSWYFKTYSAKNKITVLYVNNKIAGYFLFYGITKNLYNKICALKYAGDYNFPESEINVNTKYLYLPSVLVKNEYRQYSVPLILQLNRKIKELSKNNTIVAIAVSEVGIRMCEKYMKFLGNCKEAKIYTT